MGSRIQIIHEKSPRKKFRREVEESIAKEFHPKNIVSKGRLVDASTLPRFLAFDKKRKLVGMSGYRIEKSKKSCELVVIIVSSQGKGLGTRLIRRVERTAKREECRQVWLITTIDNLKAILFYIKRGYRLIKIHLNALDKSRKLKPQIPKKGRYGIPLKDEWEFAKKLITT